MFTNQAEDEEVTALVQMSSEVYPEISHRHRAFFSELKNRKPWKNSALKEWLKKNKDNLPFPQKIADTFSEQDAHILENVILRFLIPFFSGASEGEARKVVEDILLLSSKEDERVFFFS
ncbi:hypothetical protein LRY60_04170 [Candidatus Woesebacteria bacterium]|nr:hypothetical protein [Candidatus Woesebacteria bacterium]